MFAEDQYFRDIGGQYIFCTKSKRKKQMKTFRLLDITKIKTSSIWIDTLKKSAVHGFRYLAETTFSRCKGYRAKDSLFQYTDVFV